MIHIYEIDSGRGEIYYEVYKIVSENDPVSLVRTLENKNEFDLYIDILMAEGVDFILHDGIEEYDEYYVALPSV